MLRKIFLALAVLGLVLYLPDVADASGGDPFSALPPDGVLRTLAPNAQTWFHFEYRSSGSPIQIELTDSGQSDIRFAVYTPAQIEDWHNGRGLVSVGQIARAGGVPNRNLVWAGKFPARGTYYVAVYNPMSIVVSYRLWVLGPAISFPLVPAPPDSTVQTVTGKPASDASSLQTVTEKPASDTSSLTATEKSASDTASPPPKPVTTVIEALIPGSGSMLSPEAASAIAAKNGGRVAVNHSIRLVAGAVYPNVSFHITASRAQISGDANNPPLIIPPAGAYGIVAADVDAPVVKGVNILTTTMPQDQWKWYAEITTSIVTERKYGGVLFENVRHGVIKNVVIVGADGTTDGASHSAGVAGITLINNSGTLVAASKLNGNIFGLILAGGSGNVLLDNVIANNIRQGLVPGTGDLCNGCDSAGVAITYGPDGAAAHHNIIGLPGHGNRISGGNAVFVICKQKHTGGGGGNNNFFIENNLWAEWNGFEAVGTVGNVFVRNVINFSENTVGYWLTGSNFTVDAWYTHGLVGAEGKVKVQLTDKRADNDLSGTMRVLENPPAPDIAGLPQAVREHLQQVAPHSPFDPVP